MPPDLMVFWLSTLFMYIGVTQLPIPQAAGYYNYYAQAYLPKYLNDKDQSKHASVQVTL